MLPPSERKAATACPLVLDVTCAPRVDENTKYKRFLRRIGPQRGYSRHAGDLVQSQHDAS
jgi:hypothetical protein